MKWKRLSVWCLAAASGLLWNNLWAANPTAPEPADELFGTARVWPLKLELPPAQLEALRKEPKTYVKGTVREGDKLYTNVAVRLSGAAAAALLDKKPGLSLKFDEFEKDQYFHGHGRITLDNAEHDPSFLCEAMGGEAFRAAGVPAARVTFARLDFNGRDTGLYVLTQPLTRAFLSDHFKKTKGNFYEGNRNDVSDKLRLDSGAGKNQADLADLRKLAEAARENDPGQRLRRLTAILDTERFVSFLAAEVFTWHRKGYALEHESFRLYHDPVSDRLVFMPGGLEDAFGKATGPLVPECKGLVARAWLQAPEGQRLYRERMGKLLATAFRPDALQNRVTELAGKIRPVVARDPNDAKAFDGAVARLRETIAQRAKLLDEDLKKPAK